MLEEYLFVDRARVLNYAEQIGAAMSTEKRPQWKVGLSLTGPSVEGQQTASARAATNHEMITALVDYLKKDESLLSHRPASDKDAAKAPFVLETMKARKIIFRCDKASSPGGISEVAVWVSNPLEKPNTNAKNDDRYKPRGMFVYLLEGYWEGEPSFHAFSTFTALNVLLKGLQESGVKSDEGSSFETSRDDYASPTAVLERAGGIKGEIREIKSLYRVRSVSENKIVNVGGTTIRSYDLFGYPVFIAATQL